MSTFTLPGGYANRQRVASTGPNGYTLANTTPTIMSWTAPNDGALHSIELHYNKVVSSAETGGAVAVTFTTGGRTSTNVIQLSAGGQAAGNYAAASNPSICIDPGTTFSVNQTSGLSAGASKVFCEFWAN